MACKIRRDDTVEVISGDHKGAHGKVLRVVSERGLVFVEGVNLVYRHVRPSRRNPQGGRISVEQPIHMSNVLPVNPKSGKGSRVRRSLPCGWRTVAQHAPAGWESGLRSSRI